MSNLVKRINIILKLRNISQAELARRSGVTRATVNDWVNERTGSINGNNLINVAKAVDIYPEWLANGRGPISERHMVIGQRMSEARRKKGWSESTLAKELEKLTERPLITLAGIKSIEHGVRADIEPSLEVYAKALDEDLDWLNGNNVGKANNYIENEIPTHTNHIPWYGHIAAGGGDAPDDCRLYLADEHTGETISPPPALAADQAHKHGGLFAVTVRGASMTPTYRDGDVIYMYKNDPARFDMSKLIGQDCAVTMSPDHDSAVYIKRLRGPDNQQRGYFNLESLNPAWPTMPNVQIQSAIPVRYIKRAI